MYLPLVDVFARWKIVDPAAILQTVAVNTRSGLNRLDDIIDPAVRNFITSYRLIETVRLSNRELDTLEIGMEDADKKEQAGAYTITTGREKIIEGILKQAQPKLEKSASNWSMSKSNASITFRKSGNPFTAA